MDMFRAAFDLVNTTGNKMGTAAFNAIAGQLNSGVDNAINKAAGQLGVTGQMQNYSFSDRKSLDAFVQQMNSAGVPVVSLPNKVGDSFVAAVPQANGAAVTAFQNKYGSSAIQAYNPIQPIAYDPRQSSANSLAQNINAGGIFTQHMTGLGEVKGVVNFVKSNLGGTHHVFTMYQGGDINNREHLLSGYNNNGVFQRITVVGSTCYYANGSVCTDPNITRSALAQARKAENDANAMIRGASASSLGHVEYQGNNYLNEAQQIASTYKREVVVNDISLLQTEQAWGRNSLDRALSEINLAKNLAQQQTTVDISNLNQSDLNAVGVNASSSTVQMTYEDRARVMEAISKFESSLYTMNAAQKNLADALAAGNMAAMANNQALLTNMLQKLSGNALSMSQQVAINEALKDQHTILSNQQALANLQKQIKQTTDTNQLLLLKQQEAILSAQVQQQQQHIRDAMNAAKQVDQANQRRVSSLKDTFSNKDINLYANTVRKDLEKDFAYMQNVKQGADLTRADLVEINKEFAQKAFDANIDIFKRNGTLDVEALKNLTPDQLKRMHITEAERNFILSYNKNEFAGKSDFLGKAGGKSLKNLNHALMLAGMSGDEDTARLQQYLQNAQKTTRYAQDAYAAAKRGAQRVRMLKQRMGLKPVKYKPRTSGLANYKPKTNPSAKALNKFKAKQDAGLIKLNRKPHHLFRRAEKAKQLALEKLGQTKLAKLFGLGGRLMQNLNALMIKIKGAALKLVGAGLLLLLKASAILSAFLCVYMLIGSFADFINAKRLEKFNKYAPKDFSETVAYNLYDTLKSEEDSWLNHLGNYDGALEHYKEINYGEYGTDYASYIDSVSGLYNTEASTGSDGSIVSNEGLYINPFFLPTGTPVKLENYETDRSGSIGKKKDINKDTAYMTKVTHYDGINTMNVGTNDSVYTEEGGRTYGGYIPNIETGHTSNIKDIIAMTDVMYALELNAFFEDVGETPDSMSIMQASSYQLDYAAKESNIGWIGWAWRKVTGSTDLSYSEFRSRHNANTSQAFDKVEAYASNLFDMSHQEQWYLDVDFFEPEFKRDIVTNHILLDSNNKPMTEDLVIGKNTDSSAVITAQEDASYLYKCINPAVNTFYLTYASSKVGEDTTKKTHVFGKGSNTYDYGEGTGMFFTDTNLFPVNITSKDVLVKQGVDSNGNTVFLGGVTYTDDDGKVHYYNPPCLMDGWKDTYFSEYGPQKLIPWNYIGSGVCACWRPEKIYVPDGDDYKEDESALGELDPTDESSIKSYSSELKAANDNYFEYAIKHPITPNISGKFPGDSNHLESGEYYWGQISTADYDGKKWVPDNSGSIEKTSGYYQKYDESNPPSGYQKAYCEEYYDDSYVDPKDDHWCFRENKEVNGPACQIDAKEISLETEFSGSDLLGKDIYDNYLTNPEKVMDEINTILLAMLNNDTSAFTDSMIPNATSSEDIATNNALQSRIDYINDHNFEEQINDYFVSAGIGTGRWYKTAMDDKGGVAYSGKFDAGRNKFDVSFFTTLFNQSAKAPAATAELADIYRSQEGPIKTTAPLDFETTDKGFPVLIKGIKEVKINKPETGGVTTLTDTYAFFDWDTDTWRLVSPIVEGEKIDSTTNKLVGTGNYKFYDGRTNPGLACTNQLASHWNYSAFKKYLKDQFSSYYYPFGSSSPADLMKDEYLWTLNDSRISVTIEPAENPMTLEIGSTGEFITNESYEVIQKHISDYSVSGKLKSGEIKILNAYYEKNGLHSNTLVDGQMVYEGVTEYDGRIIVPIANAKFPLFKVDSFGNIKFRTNTDIEGLTPITYGDKEYYITCKRLSSGKLEWTAAYKSVDFVPGTSYTYGDGSGNNLVDFLLGEDWIQITVDPPDYMDEDISQWQDIVTDGKQLYDSYTSEPYKYTYTHCSPSGHPDHGKEPPTEVESGNKIVDEKSTRLIKRNGNIKVKVTLLKKHQLHYIHKTNGLSDPCAGHSFAYCGGHVGAHSHGVVYSATNSQLALAGVDEEITKPEALSLKENKNKDTELIGKIDNSTLDDSTFVAFINSGKSKRRLGYEQGTYWAGKRGPNLINAGGDWGTIDRTYKSDTDSGGIVTLTRQEGIDNSGLNAGSTTEVDATGAPYTAPGPKFQLQDIFDIDMGIRYGNNMFPLSGDYKQYEGWNADNMSLVAGRLTVNWGDVYGFDIPLEIGDHIAKTTIATKSDLSPAVTPDLLSDGDTSTITGMVLSGASDVIEHFCKLEGGGDASGLSDRGIKIGESGSTTVFQPGVSYYSYHLFNMGLSTEDIEKIDDWLETAYGANYTENRRQQVHNALMLVGHGFAENYMGRSMYQFNGGSDYVLDDVTHNHDFWGYSEFPDSAKAATGISRMKSSLFGDGTSGAPLQYTCSAGNEVSIINFLMKESNDSNHITMPQTKEDAAVIGNGFSPVGASWQGVYPGDYIFVSKPMEIDDLPVGQVNVGTEDAPDMVSVYDVETLRYYSAPAHFAVFIGYVPGGDGDGIRLSNGQLLSANTPIYIDMSTISKYTMYSRELSYLQTAEKDAINVLKTIEDTALGKVETDPDKAEQAAFRAETDALALNSTIGVMKYLNNGRLVGGIYLHGENTNPKSMWVRKNRTIDAWASDPVANGVKKIPFNGSFHTSASEDGEGRAETGSTTM